MQVRVSDRTRRDGLSREAFRRACSAHPRIGLAPTTTHPLTHVPPLSLVCQGADISWLKIQILQQPLTCALARLLTAPCPSCGAGSQFSCKGFWGKRCSHGKQLPWLIHFLLCICKYIIKNSAEGENKAHHYICLAYLRQV